MNNILSRLTRKNQLNLSQEQIIELFQDRIANQDKIMSSQFALALHLADKHHYLNPTSDIEDLFSEAIIGIHQAIQYYNPEIGKDFSPYCYFIIKQKMNEFTHTTDKIIRIPVYHDGQQPKCSVFSAFTSYDKNDEEYDETSFLSERLGVNDRIVSDAPDNLLETLKSILKPTDYDFIVAHFGLDDINKKLTLEDIAGMYGCSKQNLIQIKNRIKRILRNNPEFIEVIQSVIENKTYNQETPW